MEEREGGGRVRESECEAVRVCVWEREGVCEGRGEERGARTCGCVCGGEKVCGREGVGSLMRVCGGWLGRFLLPFIPLLKALVRLEGGVEIDVSDLLDLVWSKDGVLVGFTKVLKKAFWGCP